MNKATHFPHSDSRLKRRTGDFNESGPHRATYFPHRVMTLHESDPHRATHFPHWDITLYESGPHRATHFLHRDKAHQWKKRHIGWVQILTWVRLIPILRLSDSCPSIISQTPTSLTSKSKIISCVLRTFHDFRRIFPSLMLFRMVSRTLTALTTYVVSFIQGFDSELVKDFSEFFWKIPGVFQRLDILFEEVYPKT